MHVCARVRALAVGELLPMLNPAEIAAEGGPPASTAPPELPPSIVEDNFKDNSGFRYIFIFGFFSKFLHPVPSFRKFF